MYPSAELGFVFRDVLEIWSWYCHVKIDEIIMKLHRQLYQKLIMSATKFNYHCFLCVCVCELLGKKKEEKKMCSTPSSTACKNVLGLLWLILVVNQVHLNI